MTLRNTGCRSTHSSARLMGARGVAAAHMCEDCGDRGGCSQMRNQNCGSRSMTSFQMDCRVRRGRTRNDSEETIVEISSVAFGDGWRRGEQVRDLLLLRNWPAVGDVDRDGSKPQ